MVRGSSITRLVLAAAVLTLAAGRASARDEEPNPGEQIMAPRATYEANGVDVTEKIGSRVPLDAKFRTVDGTITTLGAALHDNGGSDLPALMTFNYSSCPMLCSLQLNGLVKSLPELSLRVGRQFRIVTIDMDPRESLERLTRMRDRYIDQLPADRREEARAGWQFLVAATPGDSAQIERVAASVGFVYKYLPERAEYAHPAALFALSSGGAVTRYVYGIEFAPAMMDETLAKAGLAEAQTAVGFMDRCYHYDPDAKNHSRAGMLALQIGAGGFLVLALVGFGFFYLRRAHHRSGDHIL